MTGVDRLKVELVIDGKKVRVLRDHEVKTGMIYIVNLPLIDLTVFNNAVIRFTTNKEKE